MLSVEIFNTPLANPKTKILLSFKLKFKLNQNTISRPRLSMGDVRTSGEVMSAPLVVGAAQSDGAKGV